MGMTRPSRRRHRTWFPRLSIILLIIVILLRIILNEILLFSVLIFSVLIFPVPNWRLFVSCPTLKMPIQSIKARQIFDSRGNPTVEVDLVTDKGLFRAAIPSGASTGIYEALELRDNDKGNYHGKGVQKAIDNVNTIIAPAILAQVRQCHPSSSPSI